VTDLVPAHCAEETMQASQDAQGDVPVGGASGTGYADHFETYLKHGWRGVLPLRWGTKWPPPTGYTGRDGIDPTIDQATDWAQQPAYCGGGMALRLPDGVIGLDVDAYGCKTGASTLSEAENRWGPIPLTVLSTSREDGISGIRLFRVPAGTELVGVITFPDLNIGDVEIIQRHHRYVVCAPSIHPEGRPYRWIDERNGREVSTPPPSKDLPEFPARWLEALRVPAGRGIATKTAGLNGQSGANLPPFDVTEAMTSGPPSSKVAERLATALYDLSQGISRHDTMLGHVLALLRFGKSGEAGVELALGTLYRQFALAVGPDRQGGEGEAEAEFTRMISNAKRLLAQPNATSIGPEDGLEESSLVPIAVPLIAGEDLLEELLTLLRQYVRFPDDHSVVAVALWVAATHAIHCWNAAPRLVLNSPQKRCGKTRALDVIAGLSHHPLITVNASAAAIFRSLAGERPPTLIIDEADTIFGTKRSAEQNEDLRALLNAGHQRNRPALRCAGPNREPTEYSTFAMVAMAGIGTMPDTITDRAVNITMRRRTTGEHVSQFRARRDEPVLHSLRDRLAVWAEAHAVELTAAVPEMPVQDRAADTWEPLIATADAVGGRWPALAREACKALVDGAEEAEDDRSLDIKLLNDIRRIFAEKDAEFLLSFDLLAALQGLAESPWGAFELTANKLARRLTPYGVKPGHNPEKTARGYRLDSFYDAFQRYTRPEPSDPSAIAAEQDSIDGRL
jgi:hypothetical protein